MLAWFSPAQLLHLMLFHQGIVLGHRMMGMIFIWNGGGREARATETKRRNGRHCGRWKSTRKSWTLSRRGQRNTTQIHSKPPHSGSLWNNLFKNQSISGGCHLCALLECQLWLISAPTDRVFTFSTVVKASGKKAAYPVRAYSNATVWQWTTECFFINKFLILDIEFYTFSISLISHQYAYSVHLYICLCIFDKIGNI